jgi:hypothetical protein
MSSDIDEPLVTKDPTNLPTNGNNVRVVGAIAGLGSGKWILVSVHIIATPV